VPEITYPGYACVRLRGRDGTVICDPFSRATGLDLGRPTAHIVTISHNHPAHNHHESVRSLRDELFLVDGPGEYEVRGVLITGVRTHYGREEEEQDDRGFNNVYVIHLDDVAFCHLGSLSHELTRTQLEEIGNVDVLFVPVGGGASLGPDEAQGVISQLEPRIIIPMRYAMPQLVPDYALAPLDKFLHEIGLKDATPQEKVSITPASLASEEREARTIVMLSGTN
jgi:L-ascorbate metabolism protein UlaG (beta-lactamase superfamily)